MIDFLREYWRELLSGAALIVTIVLYIVRKKPVKVVDTLKEIIVRVLPALINLAEMQSGLTGEDKLNFVLNELTKALLEDGYGDEVIQSYLPFAKEQVELILSTPTKKGAYTREK